MAYYVPNTQFRQIPVIPQHAVLLFVDAQNYNCSRKGALYQTHIGKGQHHVGCATTAVDATMISQGTTKRLPPLVRMVRPLGRAPPLPPLRALLYRMRASSTSMSASIRSSPCGGACSRRAVPLASRCAGPP